VAAVEQPAAKLTELVSEMRTNARPAGRAAEGTVASGESAAC